MATWAGLNTAGHSHQTHTDLGRADGKQEGRNLFSSTEKFISPSVPVIFCKIPYPFHPWLGHSYTWAWPESPVPASAAHGPMSVQLPQRPSLKPGRMRRVSPHHTFQVHSRFSPGFFIAECKLTCHSSQPSSSVKIMTEISRSLHCSFWSCSQSYRLRFIFETFMKH